MHSTLIRMMISSSSPSLKKKATKYAAFSMRSSSTTTSTRRIRLVAVNDVYELTNLPKLQSFLSSLSSKDEDNNDESQQPDAVILPGNFLKSSKLTSIDQGHSIVNLLKTSGITHVSFGVHESHMDLGILKDRLHDLQPITLVNTNVRSTDLKEENEYTKIYTQKQNWNDILDITKSYDVITDKSGQINIALVGLLSNESSIFPQRLFRNCVPINDPLNSYEETFKELMNIDDDNDTSRNIDFIVPITHQSATKDRELANLMLNMLEDDIEPGTSGIIVGGRGRHDDHQRSDGGEHNRTNNILEEVHGLNNNKVQIINTDDHAKQAACIDLVFELMNEGQYSRSRGAKLSKVTTQFIELESDYEDSFVVKSIIDKKLQVVKNLENETILDYNSNKAKNNNDKVLSSESSQSESTTFGTLVCNAIKEVMLVDAAIVNGGVFYRQQIYSKNTMTYGELQRELLLPTPEEVGGGMPTTIVVVQMTRSQLYKAISYSRMNRIQEPDGFLQTDSDLSSLLENNNNNDDNDEGEIIQVALPHHLLIAPSSSKDCDDGRNCNILPLTQLGKSLQQKDMLPPLEDGAPILDLVTRNCCRDRWTEVLEDNTTTTTATTFEGIDLNSDGVLDKHEITVLLTKVLGHKPQEYVIDDMINSIDIDGNGVIDEDEFNFVLARIERQHKKKQKSDK